MISTEQAYFFSLAILNLVFAFAGLSVRDIKNKTKSICCFSGAFFAAFIGWFIYVFELSITFKIVAVLAGSIFVWGMVVFSYKRCKLGVPWALITILFAIQCSAQIYFTQQHDLTCFLHVSGIFLPIAFAICGYLFLKRKTDRFPSDVVVGYTYLVMAGIVIVRSILLETSAELFTVSSVSTQIIWPAFCVVIGTFSLLSFTEEFQFQLINESNTDQLTGLSNRRYFDDQLKHHLPSLSRDNKFGALLYIDLDGFKPINDEYGHNIGDRVLVELGARLNKASRSQEVIARLGGDEFALLVQNAGDDISSARKHAHKIALRFQKLLQEPIKTQGWTLQVGCSIGIHLLTPHTQSTVFALKAADSAMYHSKNLQRGSISFSDKLLKPTYGITKIGVNDIDEEHLKIDRLLVSLFKNELDFVQGCSMLHEAINQHFSSEFEISNRLGLNMSPEHIREHDRILTLLAGFTEQSDESEIYDHLTDINRLFKNHIVEYDRKLTY